MARGQKRKTSTEKIYLDRWLAFHPYKKPGPCDYYYLGLSNKLFRIFNSWPVEGLLSEIRKEEIEDLCCYIACYLEDVVTGTGMMKAFTEQHKELRQGITILSSGGILQ
jgi:hypothetical protein